MTTQISLDTAIPELAPRSLRIAFIIGGFPIPSQTFVFNQIIGLLQRGHQVDIYADRLPKEERATTKIHSEVEANKLPQLVKYRPECPASWGPRFLSGFSLLLMYVWRAPRVILRCLNGVKNGRQATSLKLLHWAVPSLNQPAYDIIHCHFGTFAINGAVLREIGAIQGKLITTFHGADVNIDPRRYGQDIYKHLFRSGDLFTANTAFTANKAIALGCPEDKITILPVGLFIDKYPYQARSLSPNEAIKVITVARLTEKKGLEYSIRAVAKIAQTCPNLEYWIAGEGPLRSSLEALIIELGMQERVKLLGWQTQDELRQLYVQAHIFILSSVTAASGDMEGQGLVLQEAQAMGLPVLSTLHNGIPDGVLDGKSGFLVPERDVEALAERLQYLIEHPDVWAEMGQAGHTFVAKQYDINKLNDRLIEIYQQVLNEE